MTREELIKQCRYYKGEKECPSVLRKNGCDFFWYYELGYVNNEGKPNNSGLYKKYNGKEYKGVPFNLLASMFDGWEAHNYDYLTKEQCLKYFYKFIDRYIYEADEGYAFLNN